MVDQTPAPFTVLSEVLTGDTADVYFRRTQEILVHEGIDPTVTMEFFASRAGVLAGVREALEFLKAAVRDVPLRVEAMDEGAPIGTKQVALRLTGPYRA